MKVYINGIFSTPQPEFHISNLWFSNDNAEATDELSIDCIGLAAPDGAGFDCETSVSEDGLFFSARWRSVELLDVDENGIPYKTQLFGVKQLLLMLEKGNMSLRNISGFVSGNVNVTVTGLVIIEGDETYIMDGFLDNEPIEFCE